MICSLHDWYGEGACPKCSPKPEVTAPVTEGEIPPFLQRHRDGSFKFPKYPLDPEESAAQRKAEYAADEKEQGHDNGGTNAGAHTSIVSDGGNFPAVHDLGD